MNPDEFEAIAAEAGHSASNFCALLVVLADAKYRGQRNQMTFLSNRVAEFVKNGAAHLATKRVFGIEAVGKGLRYYMPADPIVTTVELPVSSAVNWKTPRQVREAVKLRVPPEGQRTMYRSVLRRDGEQIPVLVACNRPITGLKDIRHVIASAREELGQGILSGLKRTDERHASEAGDRPTWLPVRLPNAPEVA